MPINKLFPYLLLAFFLPLCANAQTQAPEHKQGPTQQQLLSARGLDSEPLDSFELGKYQYCGSDADCVHAVNGCCDCANGSPDVAVNAERLSQFRARFACHEVACTQMAAEPACGSGTVQCRNHKCIYEQ